MKASCCRFSSCSSTRISLCHCQQEPNWNAPSRTLLCHEAPAPSVLGRQTRSQQNSQFPAAKFRRWISLQGCFMYAVLFCIFFCSIGVNAENAISTHHKLGQAELLFDRRDPPLISMRFESSLDAALDRRDDNLSSPSTQIDRDQSSQQPQIPLPKPFDSNIGNNFTSTSCPAFFQSFLSDHSFRDCVPLSLLLQTSSSFFTIQRSPFRLTETLTASCQVNYPQCKSIMSTLAAQIQLDEHCGKDLAMQNPIVVEAFNGFTAYEPLYNAGCLKDTDGDFCFAKAVGDVHSASSSFVYYLPLGVSLPGNSQPACSPCLRNTMSVFAQYARNGNELLDTDYLAAAEQIDMQCGPQFVTSSVPNTSAGDTSARTNNFGLLAMLLGLVYVFS